MMQLELASKPRALPRAGGFRARAACQAAVLRLMTRKGGVAGASPANCCAVCQTAEVLVRYTVGLGVLKSLGPVRQDVYVDAPADTIPVHVALGHAGGRGSGKCSNILLTEDEAMTPYRG